MPVGTWACVPASINWDEMRALKNLFVSPGLYSFDGQWLQIVGCRTLKELHLTEVMPDCAESVKFYAAMMNLLAVKRPDVACYLDQVCVSDMMVNV